MRMIERLVLAIITLFFFYTAWRSAFQPEAFAHDLGLGIIDAGGYAEIRGQYAGMFFLGAMLCSAALLKVVPGRYAYTVLSVIFGGLIIGRIAELVVHGGFEGFGSIIVSLYVVDAVGFAFALIAFAFDRSQPLNLEAK